jgi:Holliday junction resolvase-like predicted endonuclease
MTATIKHHKIFGEVELITQDETTTTVLIIKTGEVKKLANKYANLTEAPLSKVKKLKATVRELTSEELLNLELRSKARLAVGIDYVAYDTVAQLGNKDGFELIGHNGKELWIKKTSMIYVNGFLAIPKSFFN